MPHRPRGRQPLFVHILVAPDSFKESLDAPQVTAAIARGLRQALPHAQLTLCPLADGGEGTAAALVSASGGRMISVTVTGPTGKPTRAQYGLLPGGVAAIEMAQAAGLPLVAEQRRDPRTAGTFGVGELMRHALDQGARRLVLGLGGSATVDGGAGCLQALGLRLLDAQGQDLPPGGAALSQLAYIDASDLDPRLADLPIAAACDVTTPLTGTEGASAAFGPQKGATPRDVQELDAALTHFAAVLSQQGWPAAAAQAQAPGSGAAGGLSFGLHTALGAELVSGADVVMEAAGFHRHLPNAHLVITGEGQLDRSSLRGKVPGAVLRAA